jgi:hypothetical protein
MKKMFVLFACITALTVFLNIPSASAQGKLEGVWKYTEFVAPGPNGQATPAQIGLLIFTKNHWSMVMVSSDKPRPDLPQNATDAQKLAAWTPFTASSGTYEVKGNTYTAKTIVSKDPGGNPDSFITIEFKIEGNTLITTPKTTNAGPIDLGYAKLVRLE